MLAGGRGKRGNGDGELRSLKDAPAKLLEFNMLKTKKTKPHTKTAGALYIDIDQDINAKNCARRSQFGRKTEKDFHVKRHENP